MGCEMAGINIQPNRKTILLEKNATWKMRKQLEWLINVSESALKNNTS